MARIPEEELERLKKEVSVQALAEARGVRLKRHGADLIGLCPFHEDKEPSLVITPGKNLWHCLGACQSGGSVIDWVMKAEGVSFRHAVELLREGLPAPDELGRHVADHEDQDDRDQDGTEAAAPVAEARGVEVGHGHTVVHLAEVSQPPRIEEE